MGLTLLLFVSGEASPAFAYRDASTLLGLVAPVARSSSSIVFTIDSSNAAEESQLRDQAEGALAA